MAANALSPAVSRRGVRRRLGRGDLFSYAALTGWVLFVLWPLYWVFTMALKRESEVLVRPPKIFNFEPTLDNYATVLNLARSGLATNAGAARSDFPAYFVNSIIIVGCSILITVVLGTLAAYALSRYRFFGREPLALLVLIVRMIPMMTVIMPLYVIYRSWGLYNTYHGLILVYQLIGLPFFIWLMRSHVASVPIELEDAARVDGCSLWQILWHIIVPLVAPGMVASGILVFIYMWNSFVFGLLLGGTEIQPVTVGILNYLGYDQLQYTRMAAASVICITPEIIAGLFIQRYIIKGLSSGAVKG
jgi:multiple sugar transport system permease protein